MTARPHRVEGVDELRHLAERGPLRYYGGGTLQAPLPGGRAISTRRSPLFRRVGPGTLGAGLTLLEVLHWAPESVLLSETVMSIGGPAIWAQATVGGNLSPNGPRCLATALVALGGAVERLTLGDDTPAEIERVALEDWIPAGGNEAVLAVRLPERSSIARGAFAHAGSLTAGGQKLVTAAAAEVGGSGHLRVALGGRCLGSPVAVEICGEAARRDQSSLPKGLEVLIQHVKVPSCDDLDQEHLRSLAEDVLLRAVVTTTERIHAAA